MKTLRRVETVVERLTRYSAYIAATALIFNMLIIVAYIVSRIFGSAIIGTEEYVSFTQVIVVSIAFGYTHFNRGLVHVGFFMKKLPGKGPYIAWLLDTWISVAVCILWVYQSIVRYPFVKQASTMLNILHKPFYLVMTIGIVIYALSQLYEAIKCTAGLFNKDICQEVQDNFPA